MSTNPRLNANLGVIRHSEFRVHGDLPPPRAVDQERRDPCPRCEGDALAGLEYLAGGLHTGDGRPTSRVGDQGPDVRGQGRMVRGKMQRPVSMTQPPRWSADSAFPGAVTG